MNEIIYFIDGNKMFAIPKKDILRIVRSDRKVYIECVNDEYCTTKSLSELEILNNDFIRTHKSCIVNMSNVVLFDKTKKILYLINNNEVRLISEKNIKKIEQYFKNKILHTSNQF